MKLAKLELSGFKSFADYTEFHFDDGITGIVGPNGCGKSNVVDAVKWVLGEMSAKSLRGDAMLDVIFNGSSNRKPMGMAEISLTFSNEPQNGMRHLPIDNDVVKVTRRLYRDATSEYLINNQIVRLKDIRELFLDTGIGVDAYSVIEQGRVTGLVEANSVDRREIFEEAAGISRFKQRKKEALRKLEKTDQNLAQSQLVLEEVEKQLRSVKVQAGRARSYQEYAGRLKELRSAYVMQEYNHLYRKQCAINEKLDGVVDELAATRRGLETKRNRRQELQLELEASTEAARKSEREMLAAQAEHQSAAQKIEFANEQIRQLGEQKDLLLQRQSELGERLTARQTEAAHLEESYNAIDQKLKAHEGEVAQATARQEAVAKEIAGLNRTIDEQKSRAIDLMRQIARFNNDINGLRIGQENLLHQRQKLEARKSQIDAQIKELKARQTELLTQSETLAAESTGLHSQADGLRERLQANSQRQAQMSQELSRQREHRSALASRRAVLDDLMAKREGFNQAARQVLTQRDAQQGFDYVRSAVADLFTADLPNAALIEAALGDLATALVVTDSEALVSDAPAWQKLGGRVNVLALDRLPAFHDGYDWSLHSNSTSRAIDLVRYDQAHAPLAHHLLGKTLVVDTLADAVSLQTLGARGYRFVTRVGEVLDPAGVLQLGDMTNPAGMITRRAEIAKLDEELVHVEERVAAFTQEISRCDQDARSLDSQLQDLRQRIYQNDNSRAEITAQLQQITGQLQRTTAEAPLVTGEMDSLTRQMDNMHQRQTELEERVAGVEAQSKEAEAAIHDLGAKVIVRQHEVAELSEAATRARVAMGQVQEQRSGLSRALATARQAVAQTQMEIDRIAGEAEGVEARTNDARATIDKAQKQMAELAATAAAAETELASHTQNVTNLRGEFAQVGTDIETLQEQAETFSRQEHELSLSKNELSVRIETLIEHTQDELGINLVESFATYEAQNMDWDAVAAEINELKGKIARLGNVNLDAINEQASLEERHQFLQAQLADIAGAKGQLEELILKINEDSRQRFGETFEKVREEFQNMFRKLFAGGKADLIMENPDDILESGIEILAKPPGKELQSITLLSGGEKTMTAVALVMSIFKSKPSPFCILDEVDAALDESNTGRFASIIEEFLHFSQFIVITHNKRTMSVANVLYGVTMQEQGVSKRVAVKFDNKVGPIAATNSETTQSAAA